MNIQTIDNNQIGGAVIIIEENGTRIMFDYGTELPGYAPKDDWDFDNKPVDAVFISHIHEDHSGKIYEIPGEFPIYLGEFAKIVLQRTNKSLKQLWTTIKPNEEEKLKAEARIKFLDNKRIKELNHKKTIEIGPFKVTPYLVDHSSYDSYLFLIETENEKCVFTGDFRNVGYDYDIFTTIKELPKHIDYLIIEGTNIDKRDQESSNKAIVMKKEINKLFKEHKHVFLMIAGTNIHGIETFINGARKNGIYTYMPKRQKTILKVYSWLKGKYVKDIFGKVWILDNDIHDEIHQSPKDKQLYSQYDLMEKHGFLIIKPNTHQINIEDFKEVKPILIYSMWRGYLDRNSPACIPEYADFVDKCKNFGFKVIYDYHISGHATPDVITKVITEINPQKAIYPVHTNNKQGFTSLPLTEDLKSKIKIKE